MRLMRGALIGRVWLGTAGRLKCISATGGCYKCLYETKLYLFWSTASRIATSLAITLVFLSIFAITKYWSDLEARLHFLSARGRRISTRQHFVSAKTAWR